MPELGFQDSRSGRNVHRDVSPDSVIFTGDSNYSSIFSSASGSVDRCSFASDAHDHHSSVSDHLAGHECREASGGTVTDRNKAMVHRNSHLGRKEKAKVQKAEKNSKIEIETDDENLSLDSARNSFSQALKECQDRRFRSGSLLKKPDRRRPASLDLNNAVINAGHSSSPRFGIMKKTPVTTSRAGSFPSPRTPNYRHSSVGVQKGWSSERVPLHSGANRRQLNTALLPYNNGRTLPSKWEDAERWIFSPVSGDSSMRTSLQQPQRRPKSKSGPLGPPGLGYYSLYSPAPPVFKGGNDGNLLANSPFSTGVMATDGLSIRCGDSLGSGNLHALTEPCMARSVSVHGCSELVCLSTLPTSQDESGNDIQDAANGVSRVISRRDMATQMSPEASPSSSPIRQSSFSPSTPSILPLVELQCAPSSKAEMRDVPIDERVTVTRWSKKQKARIPGRCMELDDWKRKAMEIRSSGWDVAETSTSISKIKREEARITAWENLQKAKAEASMRKLEMKLEKKRSSSMDKIMNKLRSAQKKAHEMRSSMLANQSHEVARSSSKALSFRRTRQIGSLSGCFTCHAF
ncbi:uncharacterized protein LOC132627849 [Lycium barbarum]|uniref:uncharacterized protein LOC132627849 n=1 Tax=Lycium barbarum TaxID=112863 RepID=UPI00293EE665|nr:uncharacterized protein LOC132627849 [Lycium barbarum]XP_060199425.1 uncharacterized protein LOC132627849 [Lycium barbarum]